MSDNLTPIEATQRVIDDLADREGIRTIVLTGNQYDRFHAELIRALGEDAVKKIVIVAEEPVECPPALDVWSELLTRHKLRADDARVRRQPDYLKHDPTKRHGRRR